MRAALGACAAAVVLLAAAVVGWNEAATSPGDDGGSDPTGGWAEVPDPPVRFGRTPGAGIAGNTAVVVGGHFVDPTKEVLSASAARLDLDSLEWTALPPLPSPGLVDTSVVLSDAGATAAGIECTSPSTADGFVGCRGDAIYAAYFLPNGGSSWKPVHLPEALSSAGDSNLAWVQAVGWNAPTRTALFRLGDTHGVWSYSPSADTWAKRLDIEHSHHDVCLNDDGLVELSMAYRTQRGDLLEHDPFSREATGIADTLTESDGEVGQFTPAYVHPVVTFHDSADGSVSETVRYDSLESSSPFELHCVAGDERAYVVDVIGAGVLEVGADVGRSEATADVAPLEGPVSATSSGSELLLWSGLADLGQARQRDASWRSFPAPDVVGAVASGRGRVLVQDPGNPNRFALYRS